ncbi:Zinc finger protein 271 [Plakobranchus ocellatus]|uniref:Zinc finger protein 271 n=1 Tax=Plakobranchus ocellatus TaxID=259542 RepID=A0AAV3Z2M5_9GAST|nr:Zinc finger protein 271 [Plakobranchus ocellatus]
MVYHCSFALCKNDSRHKDQPHMEGITFHFFPNATRKPEQCARWVAACQRPQFTLEKVTRTMVVCSKHFIGGKGPTEEYPDPMPDHIISFETSPRSQRRKNRSAKFDFERATIVGSNKCEGLSQRKPACTESYSSLLPMPQLQPQSQPRLAATCTNSPGPSSERPMFPESFTNQTLTQALLQPVSANTGAYGSTHKEVQGNSMVSAAHNAPGPATLLRSLLTDTRPEPPVSQPSGAESNTSSVDLGLITLAMLAVKSAAKEDNSNTSAQGKDHEHLGGSQSHPELGDSRLDEDVHKCGCDCVFSSRYRLWLHQSADRPCSKCNKPCIPEKSSQTSAYNSSSSSGLAPTSDQTANSFRSSFEGFNPTSTTTPLGSLSSLLQGTTTTASSNHPSNSFSSGNHRDGALDSVLPSRQASGSSHRANIHTSARTLTMMAPRHYRGGEKKTHISQVVRGKVSSFLSKKALLARLDSILTPTLVTEEEEDGTCTCNLCGEEFEKRSDLKHHKQRVHYVGTPYACECGKSFHTYFGLDIHRRERAGETLFICRQCEFAFSSETHLQKHREKQHAGEKEPPLSEEDQQKCTLGTGQGTGGGCGPPNADVSLLNYAGFNKRKVVPPKKYVCVFCQKVFRKFREMVLHKKIHKGERRFHCHVCGKPCLQSSELKVHLRTHTGERPYACTMCDKRFSTTSALQSHTRIHTGEKPFACDYCDKRFSDRKYMKSHHRTHTGERRYQCSTCGKMFTQSCARNIHERLHTGQKPFGCEECGQKFVTNAYLQKHIAAAHSMKAPLVMGVDNTAYQYTGQTQSYTMWKQEHGYGNAM